MPYRKLTQNERTALQEAVKRERDVQVVRRAYAILWQDAGESVPAVAERLQVTRQTIYNWLRMVHKRDTQLLRDRLQDAPRSGRPARQRQRIEALIRRVWAQASAPAGGEQAVARTAVAVQRELANQGVTVHERTIRRLLRARDDRFKRPRSVLARRSPPWRQQKGGSNEA
jgi:transposase